jgi:hypothetical protein
MLPLRRMAPLLRGWYRCRTRQRLVVFIENLVVCLLESGTGYLLFGRTDGRYGKTVRSIAVSVVGNTRLRPALFNWRAG